MELLDGESLATRLKRDPSVPVDAAVALLRSIGAAIGALHARGILHRDVKPSNIVLVRQGNRIVPKLLDLGAGKEVGANEEATATGLAIGSPHYMAPEQAAGRRDIDARVDQYALGVIAYQLLAGARPYENDDTGHVLAKVLAGVPYKLPHEVREGIPPELEAAVLKAMSRAREDRFPSVGEFMAALDTGQRPRPVAVAGPPSSDLGDTTRFAPLELPVETHEPTGTMKAAVVAGPAPPRSQVLVWLSLGLAVVLAGGVALLRFHRAPPAPSVVTASSPPVVTASSPPVVPRPPPLASSAPVLPVVPAPPIVPPTGVSPEAPAPSANQAQPETVTPPPVSAHPSSVPRPHAPASHATAAAPCRPTPGSPCL